MTCPDLCTAAKCEELERRIGALEQALELLEASFEAHIQQDIPQAHNYEPRVNVEADISDGTLIVDVAIDQQSDSATVDLPKPDVNVEADISEGTLIIDVSVGDRNDSATVDLPEFDHNPIVRVSAGIAGDYLIIDVEVNDSNDSATVELPDRCVNVEADISDGTLIFDVTVGDRNDSATVDLPVYDVNVEADISEGTLIFDVTVGDRNDSATVDLPVYDVNVEADISEGTLIIDVTVGDRNDLATVDLPPKFVPFVVLDVFPTDKNCFVIQASVNGRTDSDSFCIEIPEMNCDELKNLIISSFNNLDNQLANLENAIQHEVKEVYDQVTIDITGDANSDYQCQFTTDEENAEIIPGYAQSIVVQKNYTGKGLQGIHENLKLINTNLDALHQDVCKAVEPLSSISKKDLYEICASDVDEHVKREDFDKDQSGESKYQAAKQAYLDSLLANTKYGSLITNPNSKIFMAAPNNFITKLLADFSLIQGKINNQMLCNLTKFDESNTVSIVASPKYLTNVEGKVLILHFVTLENYPKRSRGSNYRPIQIPGALAEYDWDIHFKDLRWIQGNRYAELSLKGYKAKVSGWFESENQANLFFDAILNLTIAEEENRNIPKHKYPRTDITFQVTRPYRAFIESINEMGQAVCHLKYIPPQDES